MRIVTEQVACIEGQRLTTWAVMPGGERVSLGFASEGGDTHRIVLPIEALTGLLMTLPRMLQSALDERYPTERYASCIRLAIGGLKGRRPPTR